MQFDLFYLLPSIAMIFCNQGSSSLHFKTIFSDFKIRDVRDVFRGGKGFF